MMERSTLILAPAAAGGGDPRGQEPRRGPRAQPEPGQDPGPTVVLLEGSGGVLHYMFESYSTRATPKRPESRPARLFAKVHLNEQRKNPVFCVRKGYKNILRICS